MQTANMDALTRVDDPEADPVSSPPVRRSYRWPRSLFCRVRVRNPQTGSGRKRMKANILPKSGIPPGGAVRCFANSARIFRTESARLSLARNALRRVNRSIAG